MIRRDGPSFQYSPSQETKLGVCDKVWWGEWQGIHPGVCFCGGWRDVTAPVTLCGPLVGHGCFTEGEFQLPPREGRNEFFACGWAWLAAQLYAQWVVFCLGVGWQLASPWKFLDESCWGRNHKHGLFLTHVSTSLNMHEYDISDNVSLRTNGYSDFSKL